MSISPTVALVGCEIFRWRLFVIDDYVLMMIQHMRVNDFFSLVNWRQVKDRLCPSWNGSRNSRTIQVVCVRLALLNTSELASGPLNYA